MSLLEPKEAWVYGPVASRRLGASLGINVLPARTKVCSFDCLYCQYGWTRRSVAGRLAEGEVPAVDEVLEAVRRRLAELPQAPRCLTFSGNGEPTLHPGFARLVEGVRLLRDRLAAGARIAILSNSTTVGDLEVRAALRRLDLRVMKLDVGDEVAFRRFNRPAKGHTLSAVVEGLRALGDVTLQALFAGGASGNAAPAQVDAWLDAVAAVAPAEVQVYTLDRGVPSRDIEPLPRASLEAIRRRVEARGIDAHAF